MKKLFKSLLTIACVATVGCTPEEEVATITAGFTTDKEIYEMGDDVVITNTSTATGTKIATCQWDINGKVSYETDAPKNIVASEEGSIVIKLTVTASTGSLTDSFEKTVTVENNNVNPVAEFSYSPDKIVAGEPVQFTDASTDSDGTISSWEWKFGTTVVTDQNPSFTFVTIGETEVSLTVTDNKLGKNTKTITVDVLRGANVLEMIWSKQYEDKPGAYVYGTSPSMSPDGKYIYVTSSGYNLYCFDTEGTQQWVFDMGYKGASALTNDGDLKSPTPTPSVGETGIVYGAVGYNEPKVAGIPTGIFAVTGGKDGGSEIWNASTGDGRLQFLSPIIVNNYIAVSTKSAATSGQLEIQMFNIEGGAYAGGVKGNSGATGGMIGLKSGYVITASGGNHGSVVAKLVEGVWTKTSTAKECNLGCNNNPQGSQPASDASGKVYILYQNKGVPYTTDEAASVVFCYDSKNFEIGAAEAPKYEWACGINGTTGLRGLGVVVDENGVSYVTTDKFVTAISATGTKLWEHSVDGEVRGVAAIDESGYVYYNDYEYAQLVKLNPETGASVAAVTLGSELASSPTIAEDGTIYCLGMSESKPTLFAVKGSAVGHANSWSQLGGGPCKTGCKY